MKAESFPCVFCLGFEIWRLMTRFWKLEFSGKIYTFSLNSFFKNRSQNHNSVRFTRFTYHMVLGRISKICKTLSNILLLIQLMSQYVSENVKSLVIKESVLDVIKLPLKRPNAHCFDQVLIKLCILNSFWQMLTPSVVVLSAFKSCLI